MSESKPTTPGTYYGEVSPQGQWIWNGTGLPGDDWQINPNAPSNMNATDISVEAQAYVPPPFPTWPPPSGGAPFPGTELGPILNPYPYGTTQPANINTANPSPPFLAIQYPQKMPLGANGQNQGGSYQLPKMTKNWEVGPIAAPPSISAGNPPYQMGPGAIGIPPN